MSLHVVVLAVTLLVTNTNDSGPGSLRDAIEQCQSGCSIGFRIPGDAPWQTIHLQSPLPPLPKQSTIDGESQTKAIGDTNPYGPEIELDGSALTDGNGLDMNCGFVRGLAINGFPSNGIVLRGECHQYDAVIERNYIGCDPTGTLSVPNVRGVWAAAPGGSNSSWQYFWVVRDNVISGNQYSGVFIGAGRVLVRNNIIGLNATVSAPLGNGASGIAVMGGGDGSDIGDNYIGFNRHSGVAIAADALNVRLYANSFQANFGLAIDRGLDGVSSTPDVPIPEIRSARYEDGFTIIEVVSAAHGNWLSQVFFYANDEPDPSGFGEGQYYLGEVTQDRSTTYTLRFRGDLRGKWVTATASKRNYFGWARPPQELREDENWQGFFSATSEFSRAVEVK